MGRAIVIVMDGVGAGFTPDAPEFGDTDFPSTLQHVWEAAGGVRAPTLAAAGLFAAGGITPPEPDPSASYGRLQPLSKGGKDSVTGHWEMMGIVTEAPFPTYPDGFPDSLLEVFEQRIGIDTIGNKAASGTAIIAELGEEHVRTGKPIVYTSADSVFQIACHEDVVPLAQLYRFCEIARELCTGVNRVQRVIARPFVGNVIEGFTRTEGRKDYPLPPPPNLVDVIGDVYGIGVVPELFGHRGFRPVRRTQNNAEHEAALFEAMESDARFIFANFEDFDMLYGHRNDAVGFAVCLERFDGTVAKVVAGLRDGDLLILTADHGNDPTSASTDHSREYVPAVLIHGGSGRFGDVAGFTAIGATVAKHLGVPWEFGTPLI